jgi:hypothetical protein
MPGRSEVLLVRVCVKFVGNFDYLATVNTSLMPISLSSSFNLLEMEQFFMFFFLRYFSSVFPCYFLFSCSTVFSQVRNLSHLDKLTVLRSRSCVGRIFFV